jgi:hypothetical protein
MMKLLTSSAPGNVDFFVSIVHYQTSFCFETWLLVYTQSNKIYSFTNKNSL